MNQKYGTFGGVFTPSILTILGVIMYMRLPWIIGNAGITVTIGIILVAHIVSITTGLSISSIATDKKVEGGGTYYIISRSLGLPIGGMLGFALFVGLSLSVSLYLIGFSESFLAFWGLEVTKNAIRVVGTLAIIGVGTLTFISTSLAMKTQYFIMAAIIGSLLTLIFGKPIYVPQQALWGAPESMGSLIVLFAVFFPAVTGFEAGVSMSGDLKDSKKAIPIGTILAIGTGLLVYIGLTIFLGSFINADQLVNNPNVLLEISQFAPLLVAGIWGATLSSAIGSILGAPRIFQAMALDRIVPFWFAKGYGKTLEPRNALMLTFLLAEAGILIGELNLIARIVAMFFITAYGFLNLSCTLEKWASPDFRPSFKTPYFVSILGAFTCFLLMIQLDFVAFIISSVLMGCVYFYLKRKELTLDSGDTWEGIWSSLLRLGLARLSRVQQQQRNWRPNIILFSRPSGSQSHLLPFAKSLVNKRGLLSHFELVEKPGQFFKTIPGPDPQTLAESDGVFTRQLEVNELYSGMQTITQLYGFSGLEPNAVMVGINTRTAKKEAYISLLAALVERDYNLFLPQFKNDLAPIKQQSIDCWWGGETPNIHFALTVLKFLQSAPQWENANMRILVGYKHSVQKQFLEKYISKSLDEHRVQAEILLINTGLRKEPIEDIIKGESAESDLVVLGLPDLQSTSFGERIESLSHTLKAIIWIKASSFFLQKESAALPKPLLTTSESKTLDRTTLKVPQINFPESAELQTWQTQVYETYQRIQTEVETVLSHEYWDALKVMLTTWKTPLTLNNEEQDTPKTSVHRLKQINKQKGLFLHNALQQSHDCSEHIMALGELQHRVGEFLNQHFSQLIAQCPDTIDTLAYQKVCAYHSMQLQHEWAQLYLAESAKIAYSIIYDSRLWFLKNWDSLQVSSNTSEIRESKDYGLITENMLDEKRDWIFQKADELLYSHLTRFNQALVDKESPSDRELKRLRQKSLFEDHSESFKRYATQISNTLLKEIWIKQMQLRLSTLVERSLQSMKQSTLIAPKDLTDTQEVTRWSTQNHLAHLSDRLQDYLKEIPEQLYVLQETAYENLQLNPFSNVESTDVSFRKHMKFLLESELLSPLEKLFRTHIVAIQEERQRLQRLQHREIQPTTEAELNLSSPGVQKKKENSESIQTLDHEFTMQIHDLTKNSFDKITPFLLSHGTQQLQNALHRKKAKLLSSSLQRGVEQIRQITLQSLSSFMEQRSEGVILAKKIYGTKDYQTPLSRLIQWTQSMRPNPLLLNKLPYYYRQLYSSNSHGNLDFWEAPDLKEVLLEANCFTPYTSGVFLVLGEHMDGKTTLSHYLAQHLVKRSSPLHLLAPANFRDLEDLNLDDWLEQEVMARQIKLLPNTPLIIDDLELWWERSEQGLKKFNQVINWLNEQSHHRIVIANMNSHAYRLIRQIQKLDSVFIHTVMCPILSAKKLKAIFEKKQRSIHMKWFINGPDQHSDLQQARFFDHLFEISQGHIGIAQTYWLSHISHYSEESITLKKGELLDSEKYLNQLSHDQLLMLQHLIIHKKVSQESLMKHNQISIVETLDFLRKAGIVDAYQPEQWQIVDALYLPLVHFMQKRNYL